LSERPFSDLQADLERSPSERLFVADFRRYSGMTEPDPKRPFLNIPANVR